jgi:hypothetical protein
MEGRQNLAGLLSLSVVPAGCLPSCQGAVCALMDAKELPGLPVVPCAVFHPVRVPCASHGCKRAARVPAFFYLYIMYKRQKTSENKIFFKKKRKFFVFYLVVSKFMCTFAAEI